MEGIADVRLVRNELMFCDLVLRDKSVSYTTTASQTSTGVWGSAQGPAAELEVNLTGTCQVAVNGCHKSAHVSGMVQLASQDWGM